MTAGAASSSVAASTASSTAPSVQAKRGGGGAVAVEATSLVAPSSNSSAATTAVDDPTIDMLAGGAAAAGGGGHPPSSSSTALLIHKDGSPLHTTNRRQCWMRTVVVTAIALVLFAIIFPAVYLTSRPTTNTTSNGSTKGSSTTTTTPESVVPSNSSIDHLRLFGSDILTGYSSDQNGTQEMKDDLGYAAWFLVGQVVQRNMGTTGYENVGTGNGNNGGGGGGNGASRPGAENSQPVSAADPTTSGGGAADSGSNSNNGFGAGGGGGYGTNNQELNVEEGDTTVSDGQYVYSTNGNYLLVWDALVGKMVAQVQMPDVFGTNTSSMPGVASSGPSTGSSSAPVDMMPIYYPARPQINTLLYYEGRLLVIVQGYGMGLVAQQGWNESVLYDFLNTHIRVYETSTLTSNATTTTYDPVFTANLQGTYTGVRSQQGKVHVMSTSTVNTYTDLVLPFEVWNSPDQYGNLSPDQYKDVAITKAQQDAIPAFVNKMTTQLAMGDAGMPQLVKISLFQNEYSGSPNDVVEAMTFPSGILNSLALVHSFDMMASGGSVSTTTSGGGTRRRNRHRRRMQQQVAFTSVGAFLPSYWSQFYGSTTHLIIAGQGNRVDAASGYTVESTNLLSFRINDSNSAGPTVTAESAGSVDGYVINNYAMDVKDNYLRVGVSINKGWFYLTDPMPMESTTDATGSGSAGGGVAPDSGVASDPTTTTTTTTTSSDPSTTTNSTTENYMVILSMPGRFNSTDAGLMEEVGRLQLGKPNELFMAIRIYDNIAYAVTFEQTDPLYVLDLSVPTDPKIVSELNVLGFSSYLHSLNANNTLMLGVGSSADENGTVTGIKLSVYDLSDPTKPSQSAQHVILNGNTSYVYTAAQYDFKSLRVVPSDPTDSANRNLVAIPVEISDWQSGYHFNGYHTFLVNRTAIAKKCELGYVYNDSMPYYNPTPAAESPVSSDGSTGTGTSDSGSGGTSTDGSPGSSGGGGSSGSSGSGGSDGTTDTSPCYYCGYMAPRAMLFGSDLMTINNRFVRSHDVDTCASIWSLDILIQETSSSYYGCCGLYG